MRATNRGLQSGLPALARWSLGILLLASTSLAVAQDYDLDWWTVDSGGDMWTVGSDYELSGTIGQSDAGPVMTGGDYELTGGFWPGVQIVQDICRGDLNCDDQIDFADINPFVLALSNWQQWLATYPNCPPENADINGDGIYGGPQGFGDINPFVALLAGSGGQPIPCP